MARQQSHSGAKPKAPQAKPRSLIASDLEWEQIRAHARRADMNVSRYVMACALNRVPDAPPAPDEPPNEPVMEDLFDRGHPLVLNESEQRHLYELARYIAAATHALQGPVGNAPPTLREMVHILVLVKQAELREQGKVLPDQRLWRPE